MPKKSIWALDLGAWSMKIARASRDRSGAIVVDLYDEIGYHTPGAEGEGGILGGVREAVDEFATRHTVNASDDFCVAVSGGGVFSRFINLPPVPESVDDIIRYEAMQQIPFDMDQVVWDYQTVKDEHEPWEEVKVGLFALKIETIDELISILSPWRRNLRIIQQAPLAVLNFASFEQYDTEPTIVIDVGGRTTALVVIDPPGFWMRTLLVGGDSLTERIESHFGVSRREAERIKERASESGKTAQLLRVVGKPIGDILSEVQRSLGYYKSIVPDVKFNKVIGLGNAFQLRGLDRVIAEGLQTEVEVVRDVKNFTLTGKTKAKMGGGLCGCGVLLGLIAQCMGEGRVRVNLVPEKITFENQMRSKKPFFAGAVAGVIAIIGVLILGETFYGRRIGSVDVDAGRDMVAQIERVRSRYSEAESRLDRVERELARFAGSTVRRDAVAHALSELTRAVPQEKIPQPESLFPEGAYVRSIEFRWGGGGGGGAPAPRRPADTGTRRDRTAAPQRVEPSRGRGAGWSAVAGEDAGLEAEIAFEATVSHLESDRFVENVVESFRESWYADTGEPAFRNVYVGEEVVNLLLEVRTDREIFRNPTDEAFINFRRWGDPDKYELARFTLIAEVNELMDE